MRGGASCEMCGSGERSGSNARAGSGDEERAEEQARPGERASGTRHSTEDEDARYSDESEDGRATKPAARHPQSGSGSDERPGADDEKRRERTTAPGAKGQRDEALGREVGRD